MKRNRLALYVHWPFCKSRCTYCDFRAFPHQEKRIEAYAKALGKEIEQWAKKLDHPELTTLYFGGGTPSYIPRELLDETVSCIRNSFTVPDAIEFTVEANPEDVDGSFVRTLREIGANRVSLGVQTFSDALLQEIGRVHTGDRAERAIRDLQHAGFSNLSIDLMTGLPGQTAESLDRDFDIVKKLSIPHLSVYSLTLAENTHMNRQYMEDPHRFPTEDRERELTHLATRRAKEMGLLHYEISNYARQGFESMHNLTYWHLENYLGVGLSAASFLDGVHYTNTESLAGYHKEIAENRLPIRIKEELTPEQLLAELLLSGLRLDEGIRFQKIEERTGIDLRKGKAHELQRHEKNGLLQVDREKIRLTSKGKDLLDTVLVDLI